MPLTKNADGFLHQRFLCTLYTPSGLTRNAVALHVRRTLNCAKRILNAAQQPLNRAAGACCFTRPQDFTRASAPYTQQSCFTRPKGFTRPQDLTRRFAPTSYPSTFSFLCRRVLFPHGSARLYASAPYRDDGRDSSF